MTRQEALREVAGAAIRAEMKHGERWCGSPLLSHEQRLYVVMGEMREVEAEVIAYNETRMKEEVLDVMGALLGWLEVLGS